VILINDHLDKNTLLCSWQHKRNGNMIKKMTCNK